MIHFDEMTCLLYLEGQLDPARAGEMAAHIQECASCRTLLHALERESHALDAALTEENEPVPARLLSPGSWNMPSWVWTLAFGVFAAGAYWLWTDSIDPWLQQLNTAGFGGTDLMSILLFSGAFWEGWSNMTDFLQIAAFTVVVLVAFGLLRRRLRRFAAIAVVMSALLFMFAQPQSASAAEVRRGHAVLISAGETIHNDLIAEGPSVRIDGTVEGDLIVFSRNLTMTGHVTGDVIAFAGQALIDGNVDGNVRVFSETLTLQGATGKNVTAFARLLDLTPKGVVGGGMIALAGDADLDGKIRRDLLGLIGQSDLAGLIGGQLWLRGGSLTVASTAEIGGSAIFRGPQPPTVAPGAKLASPIQMEMTQEVHRTRISAARVVIHRIFSYVIALLLGILLANILPGFFRTTLHETGRIGFPIGVGALALIAGIFLLALGILLIFVGVGAGVAGVLAYAPILYVAQVFVGAWLGNKIMANVSNTTSAMIGRMALGLLILHLFGLLPVLGVLVWLVVLLWGTGAVLMGFYRMSHEEPAALAAQFSSPA